MPSDPTTTTELSLNVDWKVVGSSRRSSASTTPESQAPQIFQLPKDLKRDSVLYIRKPSLLGTEILPSDNQKQPETNLLKTQQPPPGLVNNNNYVMNNNRNQQQQYKGVSSYTTTMQGMNNGNQYGNQQSDEFANEPVLHEPLRGGDEEEEDDFAHFSLPKIRSRSKSSSAIFGLESENQYTQMDGPGRRASHTVGQKEPTYPDINSIWAMSQNMPSQAATAAANAAAMAAASLNEQNALRSGHEPALLHRRASTQPSFTPVWENIRPINHSQIGDQSRGSSPDRFRPHRRFSHAPNAYAEYSNQLLNRNLSLEEQRRRHSLAGPTFSAQYNNISEAMENLDLEDSQLQNGSLSNQNVQTNVINSSGQDPAMFHDIDDYFENTDHRTRAWVEAGKNLQAQQQISQQFNNQMPPNAQQQMQMQQQQYQPLPPPTTPQWPLYVVEFKAGRTDFFFIDERAISTGTMPPQLQKGELVIVEADRGTDLGKVIFDNIQNPQQLAVYQATNKFTQYSQSQGGEETSPTSPVREVHAKRIIRLAHPNDVAMLVAKSQDEAKAMGVCQSKIRQRRLPMEVVDAEYQWDRKKLTFYFVADRRIDFRELVRELFKLYKTRIWMCAVNPAK